MTITKVELAWKGIFMLSCVVYDLKNARPPSSFSMDFAQADQRRCLEQHICIRCFTAKIDIMYVRISCFIICNVRSSCFIVCDVRISCFIICDVRNSCFIIYDVRISFFLLLVTS